MLAVAFWLVAGVASMAQAGERTSSDPPGTAPVAETHDGIPAGLTREGRPFLGNRDAAVTLVEYTDFVCPYCALHFQRTLPGLLDRYVRAGRVKLVIEDLPLAGLHPTAPRAAAAARCVAEQGPARYFAMHDILFREQSQWGRLADPTAYLGDAAQRAGAQRNPYEQCLASGRVEAPLQQSLAAAAALGFSGTPTFRMVVEASGSAYTLIGAQPIEVFSEWIDALLAGREPPGAAAQRQQEKPELPFWARPEGLAPDPAHPGRTLAGDRYKGNPAARLVLVEFADFECPACERHALATQPLVDQRFVDTGDVLWVMKHFPLRAHPHAPAAAAAAECAGAQKKFWRMHQALYETSAQWSQARDVDAALARIAASIGLASKPFATCLASRRSLEHVLRDIYDGEAIGIKALPAFILLRDGVGHVMTGARSPEEFAATLQEQLGRTKGESGASPAVAKAR